MSAWIGSFLLKLFNDKCQPSIGNTLFISASSIPYGKKLEIVFNMEENAFFTQLVHRIFEAKNKIVKS